METEILMLSAEYRSQHREKTGKRISNAAGQEQISLYSRRMKEYGRNVHEVNGKIYKNYRVMERALGGRKLGYQLWNELPAMRKCDCSVVLLVFQ